MFGVARDGRFEINFAMECERGWTCPGFPDGWGAFRLGRATTAEKQEGGESSEQMAARAGHLLQRNKLQGCSRFPAILKELCSTQA